MRYILDTSAILSRPELLAYTGEHEIVIPDFIAEEVTSRGRPHMRERNNKLLSAAVTEGVLILSGDKFKISPRTPSSLSGVDFKLANFVLRFEEHFGKGSNTLVTEDKELLVALRSADVFAITPKELLSRLVHLKGNETVLQLSSQKRSADNWRLWIGFGFGLIVSIGGNYVYDYAEDIFGWLGARSKALMVILVGFLLYAFRQRYRLMYGALEVAVGWLMAWHFADTFTTFEGASVFSGLQLIAGLYVIVRGLDNVGKGLEGTRFQAYWERVFGGI